MNKNITIDAPSWAIDQPYISNAQYFVTLLIC